MIRRPPRSTRTDTPFPTRRSSDLYEGRERGGVDAHEVLRGFIDRTDRILQLVDAFMPECARSEEHTSELQSLMRISYAVFCLKKKNQTRIKELKNIKIQHKHS